MQIIPKGDIPAKLRLKENQYEYHASFGKVQLGAYVFCYVEKRLQVVKGMLVWEDIGYFFEEFLTLA